MLAGLRSAPSQFGRERPEGLRANDSLQSDSARRVSTGDAGACKLERGARFARVEGCRSRDQGFEMRDEGFGFRVQDLGCAALGEESQHGESFSSLLLSGLELSVAKVYQPAIRALLGTASQFCEVGVLTSKAVPARGVAASGLGVRVSGVGFKDWGPGCRV